MKKWMNILLLTCLALACVGQKEDPELEPEIPVIPEETGGEATGTRFFRRVLALDFTATWCQYCPNMAEALEKAQEERPGRIVDLSVHYSDALAAVEANEIVKAFKISAYPSLVFDWDASSLFTEQQPSRMTAYVDAVLARGEDASGLAMKTAIENGQLKVELRMTAAADGEFALCAALVEDGIIVTQTGAGDNYPCRAVLRGFLGPGREGASTGALKAGAESSVTFTADAPDQTDRLRVVACILQGGKAINALSCGINQEINYTYEKDN